MKQLEIVIQDLNSDAMEAAMESSIGVAVVVCGVKDAFVEEAF